MSPISYFDGRFHVGGIIASMRRGEAELPSWSVTESFEQLSNRFWPHLEHATKNLSEA